ncbi:MAG: PAS domain-containing protein [Burkholderiales bacterium]|nr:PAS domain-containing protein [Burkholderiales bacterium]
MADDLKPDRIEEELGDLIDNVVPTRGYDMVPVVGLGGSAGSIEALQQFFSVMPADCGLAFVVVIHLSPDFESSLAELIQHRTSMRVLQVHETQKVEPGVVYVIPPRKMLRSMDGHIHVTDVDSTLGQRHRHVAVDIFFRTLADTHGAHAAAVVLSGMDGDGAIGIKRIKERGGLTVVQDPMEAEHTGMPAAAIATGMADWVLPVGDMPARIHTYFRLEKHVQLPAEELPAAAQAMPAESDEATLRDVLSFLQTRTGRDFSYYKRATILRRIGRRMQVNGISNLAGYLNCLRVRPGEAGALLQDLLISVTNFFRDSGCFTALVEHVPALFENKSPNDVVRVWVAAAATGEEAYSLAMLLSEYARTLPAPPLIQVFATDLDPEAIQTAREGIYPTTIQADVSEERLRRFFVKEHRGYRVRRELREMVLFAVHDVLKDSPFSRLDLVSCRNLLIYLNRHAQARAIETFHFSLMPQGRLFLGSSESIDDGSPLFRVLDKKNRIFEQRSAPRTGLPVPSGPGTLAMALEAQQAARSGPVIAGRAFDVTPPLRPLRNDEARRSSWGDVHLRLLEHLSVPSVLVDHEYDILHLSPSAAAYLQFSGGEPSRNLLRAIHPALRIELRAALFQATHSHATAEVPPLELEIAGVTERVIVRVVPANDAGVEMFLVLLDKQGASTEGAAQATPRGDSDPLARQLDRELERLKSHLRDTVEQFEASTEELKASNEELQAMNEELRSATEELETSREELQSINEELTTVNQELKGKVDELGQANGDLQNLMDASAIAIVFLDRELRITRYTPAAVSLFHLIPTDVGRPLTDLKTQLAFPELAGDAQRVLERLVPVEREVGQADGGWHLARLLPYRTVDDRIAGVVLSFINITERKRAEEMRLWLAAVVAASADGIISFSLDLTILSWNPGAERLFGYSAEQAIGQPLVMLELEKDTPDRSRLVDTLLSATGPERFEATARRQDGGQMPVWVSVSPIKDGSGRVMAGTAIVSAHAGKSRKP